MRISDWSSDVCSSDLAWARLEFGGERIEPAGSGGLFGIGAQFARGDERFVAREDGRHRRAGFLIVPAKLATLQPPCTTSPRRNRNRPVTPSQPTTPPRRPLTLPHPNTSPHPGSGHPELG